jgi:phosphatidylglycerophosphatase A
MTLLLEAAHDDVELADVSGPVRIDRFPAGAVVISVIASVALRIRLLATPLTSDEGGYLAVARAWASGRSLYGQAWVDRPQGLLLLFRSWDSLTGGSIAAIRIMAMVFGGLAVVGVAYAVFAIAGRRAATVAAILVAVASANARIEGFIANGELLAGAVGAAGVAAACAYMFRGRGLSWLFVSGVLAGCAISLKQSGFDGFAAVIVCLLAGGLTGERTWRQVLRECASCLAGLTTVLGALVVHGVTLGFGSWWYAVAGYRLGGVNASDGDWHRFGITSRIAAPTIVPLIVAALGGIVMWLARSRRISRATVLLPAWISFAVVAFLTGGLFHRHYWVTLTFPLAAAAGVAIAAVVGPWRPARLLVVVACLVALPSVVSTAEVIVLDRAAATIRADDDPRLVIDERVGQWFIDHRTPESTLFAMCASAGLYAAADTIAPYPYLWLDGIQHAKGAQDKLVELFAGDDAPTFVAIYGDAMGCNPSGEVDRLLQQRYLTRDSVDGVVVLMRRDQAPRELLSDRKSFSRLT